MSEIRKRGTLFRSKSVRITPVTATNGHSSPTLRSMTTSADSLAAVPLSSISLDNLLLQISRESVSEWFPAASKLRRTDDIQCLIVSSTDVLQEMVNRTSQDSVLSNGQQNGVGSVNLESKKLNKPQRTQSLRQTRRVDTGRLTPGVGGNDAKQVVPKSNTFDLLPLTNGQKSQQVLNEDSVQFRRCISLYERKRTPHYCSEHHGSSCDAQAHCSHAIASPRPKSSRSHSGRTPVASKRHTNRRWSFSIGFETNGELRSKCKRPGSLEHLKPKSPPTVSERKPSHIPIPISPRKTQAVTPNRARTGKGPLKLALENGTPPRSKNAWDERQMTSISTSTSVPSTSVPSTPNDVFPSDFSLSNLSRNDVFESSSSNESLFGEPRMHVVPEDEDGYPEPRPPTTRKDEIFHVKDYVNVDEQAKNTPSELLEDFDFLLEHLMRDLETPLDMVRSIYMWVTSQKIPMMSAVGFTSIDTPKGFLFNIRQRKATYPELFAVLCRRAHIPCVIIHGLCKNIAYDAGEKVSYTKGRGSWNAVLVGGHWRLVHPYWGAHAAPGYATGRWGLVDSSSRDKAARIPSIATENTTNEFYFFTDPDQFLKKCLPENQEWQLVPHPISKTDFEELPFYQPAYFDLKLKEVCQESCIVHTENGVCEFQMSMPADRAKRYKFNYKLHARRNIFAEGEYDVMALENYSYHYRFEDKEYFHFRFPYIGVFKLDIFCKDSKRPLPSDWVCQYKIICAETGVNVKPLPVSSEIGWGPTDALVDLGMDSLTHKHPIINLDTEPVTFVRFALPKDRTVEIEADFVTHGMSSDEMSSHVTVEIEGEVAVVQVSPPGEGEYALQLYTRDGEDRTNICNYLMVRTNIVEDPELADIRKELDEAIDDGDVETLAHWIDRFSERGMEDRGDLARAKRKLQLSRLNRDLQEAIKRKDLDLLERALHSASSSSLRRHIGELGTQAEAMRSRLRRFKRLQHEVLAMDQKTISEMRSYPKPPPAVHAVMAATFLMLGIKEADLKKWTKIQGLISKRGKESLKRRVAEFRTDSVPPAVLTRVHEILSKYDLETVQVASVGAATFYQWAFSMATEIGDKDT